ncbi:MAG: PEP-CTERM sorting domain-containing protein [Hormoscilla sp. GUM202]|nr:PEP-CTERM sorting domain-containing protein [Hormoscilla sp. GUM202]
MNSNPASDIDNTINASYGEFSFDTRVSSYADWIDNILNEWNSNNNPGDGSPGDGGSPASVPEPSTLAGLMVLGAGLLLTGKKHRSTQKRSEA